jgi:small-conductance mechanosensitive channel/CRP-like cAMP-binding protein
MEKLLIASATLAVGLAALSALPRDRHALKAIWVAIVFSLFTAAFAREVGSPITPDFTGLDDWRRFWAEALEASWWFVGARLLVAVMHVWVARGGKLENSRLVTDIIGGAVYVFAALAITNDVLQIPIRGLLATSGVIAIVLGLALQSTLSDVFSGISINIEMPFQTGDMIQLDGVIEGTVVEVNWRATHILTGVDDIAVIPNSVVAKSRIINRSRPATRRTTSMVISLDVKTPPGEAIQVLCDATIAAATPLRAPAPTVQCNALRGNGIEYEIFFHVRSDAEVAAARTELIGLIHRTLAWNEIAVTRNDGAPRLLADAPEGSDAVVRKMRLIGLFEALSPQELTDLAGKAEKRSLAVGAVAIGQGAPGEGLFIVDAGVLEVTRDTGEGSVTIGRLGPGDHFGELSLLAGEPFSACATAIRPVTLYVVNRSDLAPILSGRPALMEEFSRTVERRRNLFRGHPSSAFQIPVGNTPGDAILQRIQRFFRAGSLGVG